MAYDTPADSPTARFINFPTRLLDDTGLIVLQDPYEIGTVHTNHSTMGLIFPLMNITVGAVATTIDVADALPVPMRPVTIGITYPIVGLITGVLTTMWITVSPAGVITITNSGAVFAIGAVVQFGGATIEYPVPY